ncbi:hypothetical protein [Methylobacterium thuringiense]|uniref:hypothetical protein n=1 Tax=Methylobacterium thuringiense TaxID=1003091 RepID=UPI001EE13327|nr:hypothetical protein [Methylobacterium thuringiense]
MILIARREKLNHRMARMTRRLTDRPSARDETRLIAGARVWLRQTERIATLAGTPEPEETAEL